MQEIPLWCSLDFFKSVTYQPWWGVIIDTEPRRLRLEAQENLMRCSSQPWVRCSSISTKKSSKTWRIPELQCPKIIGTFTKIQKIDVIWRLFKKRDCRSIKRSNAIILYNTFPAICIEKVLYMKSGEELYDKVCQSPRLPQRAVLKPNLYSNSYRRTEWRVWENPQR